jgi:hypothetical protein
MKTEARDSDSRPASGRRIRAFSRDGDNNPRAFQAQSPLGAIDRRAGAADGAGR